MRVGLSRDVHDLDFVRVELDEPVEAAGDLLELRRPLHRGKVGGRLPLEVIDHAGAIQAALHGGRDEARKLACHTRWTMSTLSCMTVF